VSLTCYNCATPLLGPWCYKCGQSAHDYHRSAHHLAAEALESFFHADGRFWRTLRRLIRQPARLTKDYLAGRRAPQIPPLRLFLAVLLIMFLLGKWATRDMVLIHWDKPNAAVQTEIETSRVNLGLSPALNERATAWLHTHLSAAIARPNDLAAAMRDNAEDFAFLMLPLSALILAAIFAFRRGFVLFDHLVFSMHSLAFQGLLISIVLAVQSLGGDAGFLFLASPVHLFVHMRGVYGTGIPGTLLRMGVLFVASCVVFALLVLGLVLAGLQGLRA
jgi:hypothetical protein